MDIKENCLFVSEIVETLDLNILGRPDGLETDFKTKKEIS